MGYSLASRKKRHARNLVGDDKETVPAGLSTAQAQVMKLQQQAGNRAVAALLDGQGPASLQQGIGTTPTHLRGNRTPAEELRAVFVRDTFTKITRALDDFRRRPDLLQAVAIVGLCDHWLAKHGAETTRQMKQRKMLVEDVRAEVWRDAGKLRAQAAYLQQFEGGEGTRHAVEAPTSGTKTTALGPASELAAGKVTPGAGNIQNKQEFERLRGGAKLITRYKLTPAEVAAIRTYTFGDYRYINPSAASNEKWLKKQIAQNKDKGGLYFNQKRPDGSEVPIKTLQEEGRLQTGMFVAGVAKLPPWHGVLYRGERKTFGKMLKHYASPTFEFLNIGSASKSPSAARKYANGQGGGDPKPDEVVSVLVVLHVTNGRDISKVSAVGGEGEVTILPGAKFSIVDVTPLKSGPMGNPLVPARYWYIVRMNQVS